MKVKKRAISFVLVLLLVLFAVIPAGAVEVEYSDDTVFSLRWETTAFITQSVSKSGSGANCSYTIQAYTNVTKIVASSTLYELKSGSYQSVSSWSYTYNNCYGYYSGYRATSGGACKFVTTYKTYVGNTLKETITQTVYT